MNALRILINGTVQGVGFRPFIYRLARQYDLNGNIRNTPTGVEILICGEKTEAFIADMQVKLPPLADIQNMSVKALGLEKVPHGFSISETESGCSRTKIPADTAICQKCLKELFTPESRYYLYPFVNCTDCGPRYALVNELPYDREKTALADFPFCSNCAESYRNPLDRRYHAESAACPQCGPKLSESLDKIAGRIRRGEIIALKGNGGFRLVVDAKNRVAIAALRRRKKRPLKPFALMALNLESLRRYVEIKALEVKALLDSARPIVLLTAKSKKMLKMLPDALAPNLNNLGIMLPQTPVDYLLFYQLLNCPSGFDWLDQANDVLLLVTSANLSGASIIGENSEAHEKLRGIADQVVSDNRKLASKCDDSVIRIAKNRPIWIRRAKGCVPNAIKLKARLPSVFATGAMLKNTFCFINEDEAFVSQHLGDMSDQCNIDYFHTTFKHFQKLFGLNFAAVACDLHPDFYTTRFAESLNLPLYRVQHHKAHALSVVAEHDIQGTCVAVILDGYGFDQDKIARGGELFLYRSDPLSIERIGQLCPMPYFSGDKVQKAPWRMALGLCKAFGIMPPAYLMQFPLSEVYWQLLDKKDLGGETTSAGRVFDAISSLLNICHQNTYEAEAAMALESVAGKLHIDRGLYQINRNNQLSLQALVCRTYEAFCKRGSAFASGFFHGSFAYAVASWAIENAEKVGTRQVILNGGCFQNKAVLMTVCDLLAQQDLKVFLPEALPFNDGGISLGQAWYAAKQYQKGALCV